MRISKQHSEISRDLFRQKADPGLLRRILKALKEDADSLGFADLNGRFYTRAECLGLFGFSRSELLKDLQKEESCAQDPDSHS